MGQDHTAFGGRAIETFEFFEQIGVRQPVEPITLDAECFESSWNRQQPSDARHVAMKCSIEAGDLRLVRQARGKALDQLDFGWEMIGVILTDLFQVVDQPRRYP